MNKSEKTQDALLKDLLDKSDAAYEAEIKRQTAEIKKIER